jgi:hypothetical protein
LNARVCIFFDSASPQDLPIAVLPSKTSLYENWGDAMDTGNLPAVDDWLRQDVETYATRGDGRFYVMQANPNNDMAAMYSAVDGGSPIGLVEWETDFLQGLRGNVTAIAAAHPTAVINAISTDFAELSEVTEIALTLMALPLRARNNTRGAAGGSGGAGAGGRNGEGTSAPPPPPPNGNGQATRPAPPTPPPPPADTVATAAAPPAVAGNGATTDSDPAGGGGFPIMIVVGFIVVVAVGGFAVSQKRKTAKSGGEGSGASIYEASSSGGQEEVASDIDMGSAL